LNRLVENVLTLARLEGDGWRMKPALYSPRKLLEGILERRKEAAERAGFRLDLFVQNECGEVRVDEDAFVQIMTNLIDNAIKFSAEASEKAVQVTLRSDRGRCVIGVRDFGPGIPAKQRKRIFRRFYRGERELTRKTKGTGLGLALVKLLAERMNIRVLSQPRDPGTEFELHFQG